MTPLKVFVTGGTGFIGRYLTSRLVEQGNSVTVLTRMVPRQGRIPGVSYIGGNPAREGPWQSRVAEYDIVINLAGASIFRRWSARAKQEIRDSRISATKNIVAALPALSGGRNTLLINCSAIGFYGSRGDEIVAEETKAGQGFLASMVHEWEDAASAAAANDIRVVQCRVGVVLGRNDQALSRMVPLFKWGLGSPLGSGRQWFSWIHIEDLVNIFIFLIKHPEIAGPVNCTAPNPVTNREMTEALGRVLGRPVFLPSVPALFMKMILGEFGTVLLEGQKVLPAKLMAHDFTFLFPELTMALADLVP